MDILVSVIVPTYKREVEILERSLQSILNQKYNKIEIIVIDDNKLNDQYNINNKSLIERINKNSKKNIKKDIIYIKNEKNLGGALSRNVGITIAKGEYITFLDDDDIYLENKIYNQLNYMVENNLDLTFSNLLICNGKNNIIDYRTFERVREFDSQNLLKYHLMYHLTGTPTFMFKSESLRNIGMFDDVPMGQEFYLMFKAISNNIKIGYLNSNDVVAYRHNDGGISFGRNKIDGEIKLYNFKRKYFSKLSFNERAYIRFRHYVVMAVAYKRNKKIFATILNLSIAFLSSPFSFIKEIFIMLKKIKKIRGVDYEFISKNNQ